MRTSAGTAPARNVRPAQQGRGPGFGAVMRGNGDGGPHGRNANAAAGVPGWRPRVARHAVAVAERARARLPGAHLLAEAVPVALLDTVGLEQYAANTYSHSPDYYDPDTYPFNHEEALIPRIAPIVSGKRVLDLYCGQGREAALFARAGFRVHGVDALEVSVERARRRADDAGLDIEFEVADVDRWQPAETGWDVVYTSLWMHSTIPDRARRIAWLRRLAAWAAPDGVLVVSCVPEQDAVRRARRHVLTRLLRRLFANARRPEPGDRVEAGLFWHDFTAAEVGAELADAGLEPVDTLSLGPPARCDLFVARNAGHAGTRAGAGR